MPYFKRDGEIDLITIKVKIFQFGLMPYFKWDGTIDLIIIKIRNFQFG